LAAASSSNGPPIAVSPAFTPASSYRPSYILTIVKRSAYEAAKTIADSEAEAHLLHLAPVSGIGDEGFATSISTGGPSYDVTVAKGGAAAEIQVNSVMSASEQHAERLVALAVAKL